MNIFQYFESEFNSILAQLVGQSLLPENVDASRVVFELPRDAAHGDLATNAAMILAKPAQKSPRDLATVFAVEFEKIDGVTGVEIAGPGFINVSVLPILWARQIDDIVKAGAQYGQSQIGAGAHLNVEFGDRIFTMAHCQRAMIFTYTITSRLGVFLILKSNPGGS